MCKLNFNVKSIHFHYYHQQNVKSSHPNSSLLQWWVVVRWAILWRQHHPNTSTNHLVLHLLPFPQHCHRHTYTEQTSYTGVCLEMNMNEGMEAAVDLCTILHTIYYIGPQGADNVNTCSFFIICIQCCCIKYKYSSKL